MTLQLPISTENQPARLSARDFWLLADAGAFEGFVKTELIEGELFVVNAVHTRHARTHAILTAECVFAIRSTGLPLIVYSTPSTNLSDNSVPEPDIAIADSGEGNALPGDDVKLAIEISDTTLAFDMGRKAGLYARHGIPEYWVADVEARMIHQHWRPGNDGYDLRLSVAFGAPIVAETIVGLIVETNAL